MTEPNLTEEDQKNHKAAVDKACINAALKSATLASYVSRFELVPMPDGSLNHIVLVLGGVLAGGQRQGGGPIEHFAHVTLDDAFVISKDIGADICVRMQTALQLTKEDMDKARARNSAGDIVND